MQQNGKGAGWNLRVMAVPSAQADCSDRTPSAKAFLAAGSLGLVITILVELTSSCIALAILPNPVRWAIELFKP
jgi:hypothetical protein